MDTKFTGAKIHKQVTDWLSECNIWNTLWPSGTVQSILNFSRISICSHRVRAAIIAWAVAKCHIFLGGLQHFTAVTDHNPLIPILNSHHLEEIGNPWLQHLHTHLMGYNFTAVWCKGSTNADPDALSRHSILKPIPKDSIVELSDYLISEPSISEIRIHQTAAYGLQNYAGMWTVIISTTEGCYL